MDGHTVDKRENLLRKYKLEVDNDQPAGETVEQGSEPFHISDHPSVPDQHNVEILREVEKC